MEDNKESMSYLYWPVDNLLSIHFPYYWIICPVTTVINMPKPFGCTKCDAAHAEKCDANF